MGLFAKKASQSFIVVNGRKFDPKTGDEIFDRTNNADNLQAKNKQPAKVQSSNSSKAQMQSARRLSQVLNAEATKIPRKSVEQIKAHPSGSNHTDLRKINKKAVRTKADQAFAPLNLNKKLNSQFEKAEQTVQSEIQSLEHDKKQAEIKVLETSDQPTPVIKKISAVSADNSTNKNTQQEIPDHVRRREAKHQARLRQRMARVEKSHSIDRFSNNNAVQPQTTSNEANNQISVAEPAIETQPQFNPFASKKAHDSPAPQIDESRDNQEQFFTPPNLNLQTREVEKKKFFEQKHKAERDKKPTMSDRMRNASEVFRLTFGQRIAPAVATALSFVVVVGYITYLNIPNLAIRVAANRAGFDASMPAFTPEGFAFNGPVQYSKGQVTIGFTKKDKSDDQKFAVTERKSNLDSLSLLESYVKPQSSQYATYEDKGLTIYVYGESDATWVNRGVWYTIEDANELSADQLIQVAASM